MIELTAGNLLEANAEALVNAVNCVGVMGKGIALQFKRVYPQNYAFYRAACQRGEVRLGVMLIYVNSGASRPRYIINFPTKRHWKDRSRIEDIEAGLGALAQEIQQLGIRSAAIPPLGCGHGGLNWKDVRPRIQQALAPLEDVRVLLYESQGLSESNSVDDE